MKYKMQEKKQSFTLSRAGIDSIAILITDTLNELDYIDKKEMISLRVSMEDMLILWLEDFDGHPCYFKCGMRFGRPYLTVSVSGFPLNPYEVPDAKKEQFIYSRLLADCGLAPAYSYSGGENRLTITPRPKRKKRELPITLGVMVCAVISGLLCRNLLAAETQETILLYVKPLYDLLLGIITALAIPMVFLNVSSGILNIGSISDLGKTGKSVVSRCLLWNAAISLVTAPILMLIFKSGDADLSSGGNGLVRLYKMIIDIIPTNLFTPFSSGNSTQIIVISIGLGITLLITGNKTKQISDLIQQANTVIHTAMGFIGRYTNIFTFIAMFTLMFTDFDSKLGIIFKGVICFITANVILFALCTLHTAKQLKMTSFQLLKAILPPFLITFSASSSLIAMPASIECCQSKLNVPSKMANFGMPLSNTISKPIYIILFQCIAFTLMETNGIAIDFTWMIVLMICSILICLAIPPIPGGELPCLTVFLAQMGLPASGIGIAITMAIITDNIASAISDVIRIYDLALSAKKMASLSPENK